MGIIRFFRELPDQIEMNRAVSDALKRDKLRAQLRHDSFQRRLANMQIGYSPEPPKKTIKQKIAIMISNVVNKFKID